MDRANLFTLPNVVGHCTSTKKVKGQDTGQKCLCVLVRQKVPLASLAADQVIPPIIEGLITDVVEVGHVKALGLPQADIPPSPALVDPKAKYRPVIGGISCGRERFLLTGTIGLPLLYKASTPVLLSNNHVIALSYLEVKPVGGEPTRQPSVGDSKPEPNITNGLINGTVIPVAATNQLAPGRVRILMNVPGFPGVTGSGYLCRIRFHAIGAAGTSSRIDLENGSLSNKKAEAILADWPGDTVQVVAAAQATKPIAPAVTATASVIVSVDAPTTVGSQDYFNVDISISPVTDFDAALFDVVYNPAVLAIDNIEDYVARLLEWEPLLPNRNNTMDAAIAGLTVAAKPELLGLGEYKATAEPEVGMEVAKSGRSSGVTYGRVLGVDATIMVNYGLDTPMAFEGQVAMSPMMIPGDSGSAIVRKGDNAVVALGFAGSDQISFATPIRRVLDRFGLKLTLGVPVEQALESIAGKYTRVWGFDSAAQAWKLYDPNVPAFVNDLKVLRKSQGYWIGMKENAALAYKGFTWELFEGWNLIGWLEE
jgi:hypothetical protein